MTETDLLYALINKLLSSSKHNDVDLFLSTYSRNYNLDMKKMFPVIKVYLAMQDLVLVGETILLVNSLVIVPVIVICSRYI